MSGRIAKQIIFIGGAITSGQKLFNILIRNRPNWKSYKFLYAIEKNIPIVTPQWILTAHIEARFLDENYIARNHVAEFELVFEPMDSSVVSDSDDSAGGNDSNSSVVSGISSHASSGSEIAVDDPED
uniref:BRCT domain-containing protein n=1 Tax=Panagrolaimus sp. JU765 TaxID=591449 RepID=A0AC34PU77_9BILA